MNPPTVSANHANAPSYGDLVHALEQIRHATAPTPNDGGHHEAAHDIADAVLKRVEARRQYEASQPEGGAVARIKLRRDQRTGATLRA